MDQNSWWLLLFFLNKNDVEDNTASLIFRVFVLLHFTSEVIIQFVECGSILTGHPLILFTYLFINLLLPYFIVK